jgi:hypothetical protein
MITEVPKKVMDLEVRLGLYTDLHTVPFSLFK